MRIRRLMALWPVLVLLPLLLLSLFALPWPGAAPVASPHPGPSAHSARAATLVGTSTGAAAPGATAGYDGHPSGSPRATPWVPSPGPTPVWINLSASGGLLGSSPPARFGAASTYFSYYVGANGFLVFGGCPSGWLPCPGADSSDTWIYNGGGGGQGSWTQYSSSVTGGPSGRVGAVAADDALSNSVVLFGGYNSSQAKLLSDTWTFNPMSNGWSPVSTVGPDGLPSPRFFSSLVGDPNPADCHDQGSGNPTGCLILFGGCGTFISGLCHHEASDTWAYFGGNQTWWNITGAVGPSPPGRWGAAFSNDSADNELVLFGGSGPGGSLGDTWAYSAGTWSQIATGCTPGTTCPSARRFVTSTYDTQAQSVLLFGGCKGNYCSNDTWTFRLGTWANLSFTTTIPVSPAERGANSLGWDVASGQGILFGGCMPASCAPDDGTWSWQAPLALTVGAASLSPSFACDLGQPVGASAVVSGGIPPYRYFWDFGGVGHSSAETTAFTFPATGTYTVTFQVNDSAGSSATYPGTLTMTVYNPPTVSVSATPTSANTGTPITFKDLRSGGAPPFTYRWRFGDGTGANVENASHTYLTPGVYVARAWANDSAGGSATGNAIVTIVAPLAAVAGANVSATDVGDVVQFNGTASGGYPAYAFDWRFYDGSGAVGQRNPVHTFSAAGSYLVGLWVNDSHGNSAYNSIVLTVSDHPFVTITGATPDPVDAGQQVTFTASVTGGASPTSIDWVFGDGGRLPSGSTSAPYTYSVPGTYIVRVWYNDSVGSVNESSTIVTVDPALSVGAAASPLATDVGVAVQFTGSDSGGTPGYSYAWTFGDAGGTSSVQSPSFAYPDAGTFTASFWVNDSAGNSGLATVSVTVNPDVAITASLTPSTGVAPLTVTGSSSPTGGTGVVHVAWVFGDGGTSSSQGPSHTYTVSGVFTARVWANDSLLNSTERSFVIDVASPLAVSAAVSPNGTHPGTAVTVAATPTGGLGTLSYAWMLNGSALPTWLSSSNTFVPHGAGNFSFQVSVSDSAGERAVAGALLSVLPNGTTISPLRVSMLVNPATAQNGSSVSATSSVTGGTGTLTYAWLLNGSGTSLGTGPTVTFNAPNHGGAYVVNLTVSDGSGALAYANGALSVFWSSQPPLVVGAVSANRTTLTAGGGVSLSVLVSGGLAPYTFAWSVNGSSSGSWSPLPGAGSSISTVLPHGGTYAFEVVVTDRAGSTGTGAPVTVNVAASPWWNGGPGGTSGPSRAAWVIPAVLLVIALLVVGIVLYLRRRRSGASAQAPKSAASSLETAEPEPSGAPGAAASSSTLAGTITTSSRSSAGGAAAATPSSLARSGPVPASTPASHRAAPPTSEPVNEGDRSADAAEEPSVEADEAQGSPPSSERIYDEEEPSSGEEEWAEEEGGTDASGASSPSAPPASSPSSAATPGSRASPSSGSPVRAAPVVTPLRARSRSLPSGTGPKLSVKPKGPAWPMVPYTVVESKEVSAFWEMVAASGVDRSKLLVICLEAPGTVAATFGLAGATFWRISRSEGEENVAPADVDRMGYFLESHFGKGTGRAVVFRGIERIIDGAGLRNTVRLLEVARETAEGTRGAVLIHLNPENVQITERRSLEEGAKIVRLLSSSRISVDDEG